MSVLFYVLAAVSQVHWPGVGDIDDCAVIATFYAAMASGFPKASLPTVAEFRKAAGRPDAPGATGLSQPAVWAGVMGTALAGQSPVNLSTRDWSIIVNHLRGGHQLSVALDTRKLPVAMRCGFLGWHRCGASFDGSRFRLMNPLQDDGDAPFVITLAQLQTAMVDDGWYLAVSFPARTQTRLHASVRGGAFFAYAVAGTATVAGKVYPRSSGHTSYSGRTFSADVAAVRVWYAPTRALRTVYRVIEVGSAYHDWYIGGTGVTVTAS